jgi:hypothetical protein
MKVRHVEWQSPICATLKPIYRRMRLGSSATESGEMRCVVLNGDLLAGFRRWFPTVGERLIMLPWDWLPQQ